MDLGLYTLTDDGEPQHETDTLTWARWMEAHNQDRVVLRSYPARGVWIATDFLGLDQNHLRVLMPETPPLLWESMVFGGPFDLAQQRYTTQLAALRGHAQLVALHEHYYAAPRRTKKVLGKCGVYVLSGGWRSTLHHGERRRVARVLARLGVA
jgi:hypothetical protein